jgi:dTDP-4-dehydrorhamnose reductase|tara:strand:+ start:7170 stop:8057 length:888 start_codon:yes stop_codon:yes gene_type:complete
MKKIYIIGASGLIGGALYKNLIRKNILTVGTFSKNKEDDLLFFDLLKTDYQIFEKINKEDTVFFMTAYSNPGWISKNKEEAKLLNYEMTKRFIDYLIPKNPRLIFMSSVEIFDGKKGNYSEEDNPNPLNYYGELKLQIEKYLKYEYKNYCIVRTGWNVGLSQKSRCVIQLTYETLIKPSAKMAKDNFFSLASTEDTAEVISNLMENHSTKIIHVCSDKVISRVQLADMIMQNSLKSKEMQYDECLFENIVYDEPRGRVNNLNNSLSKKIFNTKYKSVENIILDKIAYIDKMNLNG